MWNPKTKKVSETHDMVFFNRIQDVLTSTWKYKIGLQNYNKKNQDPDDTELESVWQDKRGDTLTMEFDAEFNVNDDDASVVDSMGSFVPDTPMVND